jgi:hypothetical protein
MQNESLSTPPLTKIVFITSRILAGLSDILVVSHSEDGEWQFLDNALVDAHDVTAIELSAVLQRDDTVQQALGIQKGMIARRSAAGARWHVAAGRAPLRLTVVNVPLKASAAGMSSAVVTVKRRNWGSGGAVAGFILGIAQAIGQAMAVIYANQGAAGAAHNVGPVLTANLSKYLLETVCLAVIGALAAGYAARELDVREQIVAG